MSPFVGESFVCGGSQHGFGVVSVDFVRSGKSCSLLHNELVKIRNAEFERVRHAHFVGFQENVARQPEVEVEILLLFKLR